LGKQRKGDKKMVILGAEKCEESKILK